MAIAGILLLAILAPLLFRSPGEEDNNNNEAALPGGGGQPPSSPSSSSNGTTTTTDSSVLDVSTMEYLQILLSSTIYKGNEDIFQMDYDVTVNNPNNTSITTTNNDVSPRSARYQALEWMIAQDQYILSLDQFFVDDDVHGFAASILRVNHGFKQAGERCAKLERADRAASRRAPRRDHRPAALRFARARVPPVRARVATAVGGRGLVRRIRPAG